jgi:hypothetical protein
MISLGIRLRVRLEACPTTARFRQSPSPGSTAWTIMKIIAMPRCLAWRLFGVADDNPTDPDQ